MLSRMNIFAVLLLFVLTLSMVQGQIYGDPYYVDPIYSPIGSPYVGGGLYPYSPARAAARGALVGGLLGGLAAGGR
ncbi:hypothetical protein GCK32_006586 [Trichostrongylus colubriformis]|uniref:Uncharacterized protein n=1 Tax=Trichostrongylus colubriformis TaxID=6319 RepID=A0AAN8G1R2_TRICO